MIDILTNTTDASKFDKFDQLRISESRLDATLRYFPESSEISRQKFIIADLQSKMTSAELTAYDVKKNAVATAEELKKQRAADIKRMNENRDSQSI
jgi:hypothetical protein